MSEIRYIYNIVPMLVLAVSLLGHLAALGLPELWGKKYARCAVLLAAAALCLWEARCVPPDYLYDEYSDYDELLQAHSGAPCVYMDDNYFSPITFDMIG